MEEEEGKRKEGEGRREEGGEEGGAGEVFSRKKARRTSDSSPRVRSGDGSSGRGQPRLRRGRSRIV